MAVLDVDSGARDVDCARPVGRFGAARPAHSLTAEPATMATDLTLEFKRICASMPQPEARAASPPPARTPPYVRAFTAACDDVGALTARTRASLAELGDLVRRSSIFQDPAERIAHLMQQTSDHLSRALGALRAAKRAHLDPHRSPRPPLCFAHCASIEAALSAELEALGRDFKAVMRERSDAVKKQAERRELFGKRRDDEAQRPQRQRVPVFDAAPALPRPDGTVSSGGGVSGVGAAQQQQQQLIPDDQYAVRRADASQQIEAQVAEISSIFGRVSQLIKDQNESVERIEFNVEAADADVESAQEALLAKLGAMSSNTATALKVGGIVCATLVAYILII